MEPLPPSLGTQIAGLRSAVQAQERCAWIPSAVHDLIMAIVARIFGRLEHLIGLWQSGQLPAPPVRRPPAARPRQAFSRQKSARRSSQRRTRSTAAAAQNPPRPRQPSRPARIHPLVMAPPRPPHRGARARPPVARKNPSRDTAFPRHFYSVFVIKHPTQPCPAATAVVPPGQPR